MNPRRPRVPGIGQPDLKADGGRPAGTCHGSRREPIQEANFDRTEVQDPATATCQCNPVTLDWSRRRWRSDEITMREANKGQQDLSF